MLITLIYFNLADIRKSYKFYLQT